MHAQTHEHSENTTPPATMLAEAQKVEWSAHKTLNPTKWAKKRLRKINGKCRNVHFYAHSLCFTEIGSYLQVLQQHSTVHRCQHLSSVSADMASPAVEDTCSQTHTHHVSYRSKNSSHNALLPDQMQNLASSKFIRPMLSLKNQLSPKFWAGGKFASSKNFCPKYKICG